MRVFCDDNERGGGERRGGLKNQSIGDRFSRARNCLFFSFAEVVVSRRRLLVRRASGN